MSADRVEIVHPPTGVHALIQPRVVPGWQRMGWQLVDEADATHPVRRRAATNKLPADGSGTTGGLAAGSSSQQTEGAQP